MGVLLQQELDGDSAGIGGIRLGVESNERHLVGDPHKPQLLLRCRVDAKTKMARSPKTIKAVLTRI